MTSPSELPDRRRVYVAHALSGRGDREGGYLRNANVMSAAARALVDAGWLPFNPAADLLLGIVSGELMPNEAYKRLSFAYLEVCDLMLVIGRITKGVDDEIRACEDWGIPYVLVPEVIDPARYPRWLACAIPALESAWAQEHDLRIDLCAILRDLDIAVAPAERER